MQQAFLTVDLGFGDAGKGAVVDFLTREQNAHTVVRFNGGAQAAHRVVVPGQGEHVFSQFGSGTLAGAGTHLSRFMLLEPLAMLAEAEHLRSLGVADPFAMTTIDAGALVITPFQRAVNRLKELARGAGRHGSCGMGIGETAADALELGGAALRAGDLLQPTTLLAKLAALQRLNQAKLVHIRPFLADMPQARAELALLEDSDWRDWLIAAYATFTNQARIVPAAYLGHLLAQPGTVVFEAAQGVLLDEWRGFHPYTTWSTTTLENANTLLAEHGYRGTTTRLGLTRAYTTRHGAGPMPSESSALAEALPDACNHTGTWQGGFRVGWLDLVLLRYACAVAGPLDGLAVTCLDRLDTLSDPQVCHAYASGGALVEHLPVAPAISLEFQEQLTDMLGHSAALTVPLSSAAALPELLAQELGLPVLLESWGAEAAAKRWRFANLPTRL